VNWRGTFARSANFSSLGWFGADFAVRPLKIAWLDLTLFKGNVAHKIANQLLPSFLQSALLCLGVKPQFL